MTDDNGNKTFQLVLETNRDVKQIISSLGGVHEAIATLKQQSSEQFILLHHLEGDKVGHEAHKELSGRVEKMEKQNRFVAAVSCIVGVLTGASGQGVWEKIFRGE